MSKLCASWNSSVTNGHCGISGHWWTDSWKWAFLLSQRTQLAAQGWAGGLQRSLITPFSYSNTVLATLGTPWLLAFPPNPSAEWGSSSQAQKWLVGLAETSPFSLFRSFCLQWLAILHNLTKPLLYPISPLSVCPLLSPRRHSTDNVPFTAVISLLPLKQLPGEKSPNPHELSLVTSVSSPQPALLPFQHVCTASLGLLRLQLEDVYFKKLKPLKSTVPTLQMDAGCIQYLSGHNWLMSLAFALLFTCHFVWINIITAVFTSVFTW